MLNTEGNPMIVHSCDGDPGQEWSVYSDGTLRVQGGCLDVVSAGTTSGTDVDWYPCNGTPAQDWTYESDGELVNPNSGLCLTDPGGATGTQLQIQTCADSADQQWTLPTATSGAAATVTASDYSAANSVGTEPTSDTGGGDDVGWINSSSWLEYQNVNFGSGLSGQVEARIASSVPGTDIGTIQFRLGSLTATPVPSGTQTLYVTFMTDTGGNFVNVNWFQFS